MKVIPVAIGGDIHAEGCGPRSLIEDFDIILDANTLPTQLEGIAERLSAYLKTDILQTFLMMAENTDN